MANAMKQGRPQRRLDIDVYTLACERMAEIFDRFDHVGVSFSGGKDSTAVLQVALEVARSDPRFERHLPLRACFQDEEAIPYETEQYVQRMAARPDVALEWYCIPIRHRNACSRSSPWWWPWAEEARDRWCRPMPAGAITHLTGFPNNPPAARLTAPKANGLFFPPHLGNCAMVMGIRAAESITRQRAVSRVNRIDGVNYLVKQNHHHPNIAGNLWKAYPIYDWTTEDVWTAPATKGWDYNRAYDRLEMAGIGHSMQRCSPAFGEEPLQKLHTYAACFPDVWERMVDRVPGVGSAARYALTELYAYRDRPDKPTGVTWPEFIANYVAKFGAGDRAAVVARLADEIRVHYRKTTHPIAARAAHPLTGVSWDFLLTLAMRGDFKGRRYAGTAIQSGQDGRALPRMWHKYAADLTAALDQGATADLAHPGRFPTDPYALIPDYARPAGEAVTI